MTRRIFATIRVILSTSLAAGWLVAACGPVPIEALPDADAGSVADTAVDVSIDINQDIQNPFGDATDAAGKDVDPDAKELCNNLLDENGDGRTDEGCWPAPNLRADQTWHDFGLSAIGGAQALAPTFALKVEAKNQAMVLAARDVTSGQKAYVWAEQLTTPTGLQVIVPGLTTPTSTKGAENWIQSPNRTAPNIFASTALIGESPEVTVVPGTWTFGFVRAAEVPWKYTGPPQKGYLQIGVLSRPDAGDKPLQLDLDVFLVGGTGGMSAADFAKSFQWQQIRTKVESIWNAKVNPGSTKTFGLTLGTVEFFVLDGDAGTKFKYLDNVLSAGTDNELTQVYAATGLVRGASTAVTLVLVSGLNDNNMPVAVGLSQLGGINGLAGSRLSGMAVVLDEATMAQSVKEGPSSNVVGDIVGVTLAHEMGHFLGLWHTDEHDGILHDPLHNDTPECKSANITTEACPIQAANLMFWTLAGAGKFPQVAQDQRLVVRRSPALHP